MFHPAYCLCCAASGLDLDSYAPLFRCARSGRFTAAYTQAGDGGAYNIDPAGTKIEFWLEVPDGFTGRTSILHKPGAYELLLPLAAHR